VKSEAHPNQLKTFTGCFDEALPIKYRDLPSAAGNQTSAFQFSGSIRNAWPLDTQHIAKQVVSDRQRVGLKLCWKESGGPAVKPPRGFGSTLVKRTFAGARLAYDRADHRAACDPAGIQPEPGSRQPEPGRGRVVLLSDDAGIGKSWLTVALLERLAWKPQTCLRFPLVVGRTFSISMLFSLF
jgi:hypothetical protein